MNLQELGAVFRQEREKRGLSVQDVVQRTKISRRNVQAIESGRKEDLPHPVYAKGFVKNYARLLGLDPEEYAAALSREYFVAEDDFGNDPTRDKPISMTASRNVGPQGRRSGLRGVILFLLVAAVGGAILWSTVLAPRLNTPAVVPAPQAAPAPPAEPEPAPPAQEPQALNQPAGENVYVPPSDLAPSDAAPEKAPAAAPAAAPAKTPVQPAKPTAELPTPKPAPVAPAKPAVEPPAPKPAPAAPAKPAAEVAVSGGARTLDIKASQLCWVNAEVDGATVLDMVLQPGEAKTIRFDKALTVKFGNAGGVHVALDNKPFPLNAQSGEVRTVTIP